MVVRIIEIFLIISSILCFSLIKGDSKIWKPIDKPCLCKEFRCDNGTVCLHAGSVCDGVIDCPNGEDEKIGMPKETFVSYKCKRGIKANCKSDEFKCKFGDCVKLAQVCDGKIDCYGGVDEAIDFCTWVNSK